MTDRRGKRTKSKKPQKSEIKTYQKGNRWRQSNTEGCLSKLKAARTIKEKPKSKIKKPKKAKLKHTKNDNRYNPRLRGSRSSQEEYLRATQTFSRGGGAPKNQAEERPKKAKIKGYKNCPVRIKTYK